MSVDYSARVAYGYKIDDIEYAMLVKDWTDEFRDEVEERWFIPLDEGDNGYIVGFDIYGVSAGCAVPISPDSDINTEDRANLIVFWVKHCLPRLNGFHQPRTYLYCQYSY